MAQAPDLLLTRNLTKVFRVGGWVFGETIVAVNQVTLSIPDMPPRILSIVGESGSGKTTLARLVLRLLEPTRGEVQIAGRSIWKIRGSKELVWFKRTIQPIFQNPYESFNPVRPVSDVLLDAVLKLRIARSKSHAESLIAVALEQVGLEWERVKGKFPHAFSGGELQRLSVARSLLPSPRLIIADEPVSSVDASLRMGIVNLFAKLKRERGISFVYITHDLSTASYVSDDVAVMYSGQVIEYGPASEVIGKHRHPYTELLVSAVPTVDSKWTGAVEMSSERPTARGTHGCLFFSRCPYRMTICKTERPPTVTVQGTKVACFKYDSDGRRS